MSNKYEQLKELGFQPEPFEQTTKWSISKHFESDRFGYKIDIYEDDQLAYVHCHFMRGTETVTYDSIKTNFNNLNPGIKSFVESIEALGFTIYNGV